MYTVRYPVRNPTYCNVMTRWIKTFGQAWSQKQAEAERKVGYVDLLAFSCLMDSQKVALEAFTSQILSDNFTVPDCF